MFDRNLLNYDYNVPYAKTLSALHMVATGHMAKRTKRFANKAWTFSRYMEMIRLVKELRLTQASAYESHHPVWNTLTMLRRFLTRQ